MKVFFLHGPKDIRGVRHLIPINEDAVIAAQPDTIANMPPLI
ncbi:MULTISPECIES: hypothetical protein [unclassified Paraburkholderia]|nr:MULTISPECIES: hypothetical protein [unclassified Paraburkholderia]